MPAAVVNHEITAGDLVLLNIYRSAPYSGLNNEFVG